MSYLIHVALFILLALCTALGITLYYFICKNDDLEDEINELMTDYTIERDKVSEIEFICARAERVKENYFVTIDKINRVINPLQTDR